MHGLIFKSVQVFVCERYGSEVWDRIASRCAPDLADIDIFATYDQQTWLALRDSLTQELTRGIDDICEDIGTFLVSSPATQRLCRLLRFGGVGFEEFLDSLNDLTDRARLAVPGLDLPQIDANAHMPKTCKIFVHHPFPGFSHALVGLIRGMADEYGALAMVEHRGVQSDSDMVTVELLDRDYAPGRAFVLGAQVP